MNTNVDLSRIAAQLEQITALLLSITGIAPSTEPAPDTRDYKTFGEFAQYYFDTFRWRKVGEDTKRADLYRYNKYILPTLGDKPLNVITPGDVQALIDGIAEDLHKTQREVLSLVNIVMKNAIRHHYIDQNPCDIVYIEPYEKEHGSALTKDEEHELLAACVGTRYQLMFAVALYCGLRPCEYKTARIEGDFIIARNAKQKDGKTHYKRIPITPMLAPYISADTELRFYITARIRDRFKEILPQHKLYDLRTTFYTRCQECGVSELARNLFVGHSLGGLADTYTDVSDEYRIAEAQKLRY